MVYNGSMKNETEKRQEKKYNPRENFIVLVLGGHAGDGYSVPFLYWLKLQNPYKLKGKELTEEIRKSALNIPRVKHDQDNIVLGYIPCTSFEGMLVELINNFDPYLTTTIPSGRDLHGRRIRTLNSIKIHQKNFEKSGKEEDWEKLQRIKHSIIFDDDHPIQQACSPILQNGKYIHQKVDMKSLLSKFFTQNVRKYAMVEVVEPQSIKETREGIERLDPNILKDTERLFQFRRFEYETINRAQMLMIYYRLFGEKNPLGIKYNKDKHVMTYPHPDVAGTKVIVPIPNVSYLIAIGKMVEDVPPVFKTEKQKASFERRINETIEDHFLGSLGNKNVIKPIYGENTLTRDDGEGK